MKGVYVPFAPCPADIGISLMQQPTNNRTRSSVLLKMDLHEELQTN